MAAEEAKNLENVAAMAILSDIEREGRVPSSR